MSTVSLEYVRFMNWLGTQEPNEDICKIANVIQNNLPALITKSSSFGWRAKALSEILTTQWSEALGSLQLYEVTTLRNEATWTKLNQLILGPFRGYAQRLGGAPQGFP